VLSGLVVVVRRASDEEREAARGRSREKENAFRRRGDAEAMSSPPLVRKRLPKAAVPGMTAPNWLKRTTATIAQAAIPYPRSKSDTSWSLNS